ncbi:MAG: hypothetical protein B7733_16130 [Myxococcales bacterium FL481]|nr:MAG: hypothetical protein B7733_16130 [Myxococcales bacterium FL481]
MGIVRVADDVAASRSTGVPQWMFGVFFASGMTGLLYEAIWSRYVRLLLGSAATAQVVVLALFMGGLSLGAMLVSRKTDTIRRPFLAYAGVEVAVGVYALVFPWWFAGVKRVGYDWLLPAVGGGPGGELVAWAAAAVLVLPPCILLGATFPLMSAGMLRIAPAHTGRLLALLYFWNSLGAAVGAVVTGFALVPQLGLPGTLAVGGGLNLIIGYAASRRRERLAPLAVDLAAPSPPPGLVDGDAVGAGPDATAPHSATEPGTLGSRVTDRSGWGRLGPVPRAIVWALAGGTGLASFIYEVGWMRLLATILGSATHSFEVMLSAFVLGLALGGWFIRRRIDRLTQPAVVLAGVQLVMGMLAVATLPLYRLAAAGIGAVFYQDERTYEMWLAFNFMRYVVCLVLMLPATFCAGMTLPLLTHWVLARGGSERAIGHVYAVNTLGSIAGAVLAGMVFLPTIGLVRTIVAGAFVDMVLGLMLLFAVVAARQRIRAGMRAALGSAVILALGWWRISVDPHVITAGVFRRGTTQLHPRFETVSHVDGRTASITVMRDGDDPSYHAIYTNGKPDASIRTERWPAGRESEQGPRLALDEPTQILVGALPLLAHPSARRAALIGLGSGVTSHTLLASPELESLEVVEIEPEMARAARRLGPNNARVFEDPRSRVFFDDAKAHFAGAHASYDIVVSQPSNPWVSGVSSLFTVEFYAELRRYLAPGGVLAQWVQGYELSDDLLYAMLAAVQHEFVDYRIFRVGSRDWLIVARADGDVAALSSAPLAWPRLRHDLGLLGVHDVTQLDALLTANRRMLAPTLATVAPNRDAQPILDSFAERSRFLRHSAEALLALRLIPLPLREGFGDLRPHAYPVRGILDQRESKHVLVEPEKARALLAAFERGDVEVRRGESEMQVYLARARDLAQAPHDAALARAWFVATFEVYNRVAPWVDLRAEPWWHQVRDAAGRPATSQLVRRAVALLDAAVRRDGPALIARAEIELAASQSLLDPRLSALAGALGLVLTDASGPERRRFAEDRMAPLGRGSTSDDAAFRLIEAIMMRSE